MLEISIGIATLIASIIAIIIEWWVNRPIFEITNAEIDFEPNYNQRKIEFTILNTGSRAITVLDVKLFKEKKQIKDNQFDPVVFEQNRYEQKSEEHKQKLKQLKEKPPKRLLDGVPPLPPSKLITGITRDDLVFNFQQPYLLMSGSEIRFSYFVDIVPDSIEIRIKSSVALFPKSNNIQVSFDTHPKIY